MSDSATFVVQLSMANIFKLFSPPMIQQNCVYLFATFIQPDKPSQINSSYSSGNSYKVLEDFKK